jgi:FKBP-type peptidyl-prolyl cis-trans isomerase
MSQSPDAARKANADYLHQNMLNDDVEATASGLQYKVIEAGAGVRPDANSTVTVHYRGTLIDGSEFDSSYKRGEPITFPLSRVIQGWQEGLQMMQVGAKYELYIPYNLGYGERGTPGGPIPPYATLIFEVELLDVK